MNRYDDGEERVVGGETTFDFTTSFRVGYLFEMSNSDKITTYLGVGINPQYDRAVVEPKTAGFKTATTEFETDVELLGSLSVKLADYLILNMAAPIKLWSYKMVGERTDNPQLSQRAQRDNRTINRFFPTQFELRFALVYLI